MNEVGLRRLVVAAVLGLLGSLGAARAAVVVSGDVVPGDPATWSTSVTCFVGKTADGTVTVNGGSVLSSRVACLGYEAGTTGVVLISGAGTSWTTSLAAGYMGTGVFAIAAGAEVSGIEGRLGLLSGSSGIVTVDGEGSTWSNRDQLYLGGRGNAILNITGGGTVTCRGSRVAGPSSHAEVHVDGVGSTWTIPYSYSYDNNLFIGNGGNAVVKVTGGGAVSAGATRIGYNSEATCAVIVDGAGSRWMGNYLDVVYGTLRISGGGTVQMDEYARIGSYTKPHSMATVTGVGSTWTTGDNFFVGLLGSGALRIAHGGTVHNGGLAAIVGDLNATSVATVADLGSTWVVDSDLDIGYKGEAALYKGALHIVDGGEVRAANVLLERSSLLTIDVGSNSRLVVGEGSGTLTQNGDIYFLAGPGAVAGSTHQPVATGNWWSESLIMLDGLIWPNFTCWAIGGTWDYTSRVFTVSDVQTGSAGVEMTVNLAEHARIRVDDAERGWSLGASLRGTLGSLPVTFEASVVDDETLADLQNQLGPEQALFGAWEVDADRVATPGSPAFAASPAYYLSFDVGPGQVREGLQVWQYDGDWAALDAADLAYDGEWASFGVYPVGTGTFHGCYAITTVPEPGVVVLALGLVGLLILKRRRG